MKKIKIKRLIYTDISGQQCFGGIEYDGRMDDFNILGAVHEVGKTQWINNNLWLLRQGVPAYRISVGTFTQYQKRWYELLFDALRRI
jgi:hypothetical protein